jgi:uncharacterized membrane protein YgcG
LPLPALNLYILFVALFVCLISVLPQMEYSRFMWQLTRHLQDAVATGTARKAAKREPTSSPGGMDISGSASASAGGGSFAGGECQLQALTSRRG